MKPEVRNERVLSAILEVQATANKLTRLVPLLQDVASQVDTVISWKIITRLSEDGSIPIMDALREMELTPRPNAKINLGIGRPLVED